METFARGALSFPVLDSGPAAGDPVVLLHGFPQTPSSYDPVVALLHEQGFRTLVPTQRGYAATNRPPGRRSYRIVDLAEDVLALLDAAGVDQVDLVGHDWGGVVAWAFAAWHPRRVRSLAVLSTPHPAAMRSALLRSDQALKSWYLGFFQLPWLPEQLLATRLPNMLRHSGLPPDAVADYGRALNGQLTGPLNWYRGLPFSHRPEIGEVTVPTTYLWGRTDFALGRKAAELTAEHITGDYRFLEIDAGHWLPETRPDEVAAAISARAGQP